MSGVFKGDNAKIIAIKMENPRRLSCDSTKKIKKNIQNKKEKNYEFQFDSKGQ